MTPGTRIEAIVTKLRIPFTRRGGRLWAPCPFHEEREASWMIRCTGARAGQHHCFGCKGGGGLVELVMAVRGYGTREAAKSWLEDYKEAPGPPASAVRMQIGAHLHKGFRLPIGVILEPLESWVSLAKSYALERGLTSELIEQWHIGYAVEGRLEGRLVFPVWTQTLGALRAHGYMARTFVDDAKRYLMPHERERPNLDALYGEMHWPAPGEVRRASTVFVVEGALKGLAIARTLGSNIAALAGSDVRAAHVAKLATFGEVVLVTDSDTAGDRAAAELLAGLDRHTRVRRVRLPSRTDPDSILQTRGPEELRRCLVPTES